jgi:hypothetical protein
VNFSDYEILGFNLGGLFLALPLIAILVAALWFISSKDQQNSTEE